MGMKVAAQFAAQSRPPTSARRPNQWAAQPTTNEKMVVGRVRVDESDYRHLSWDQIALESARGQLLGPTDKPLTECASCAHS
jgi:hypothetical protein